MSCGECGEEAVMPPRWLCCLIAIFWLTMMGWLFWRDLWPNWRPGEPPPFHIDDIAEVQRSGNPVRTGWRVERWKAGGSQLDVVCRIETWLEYDAKKDIYSLKAEFDDKKPPPKSLPKANTVPPPHEFYVSKALKIDVMTTEYRVTHAGRLHSLEATVTATFDRQRLGGNLFPRLASILRPQLPKRPESTASAERVLLCVWGEVRDDQFFAHCCAGVIQASELVDRKSANKPIGRHLLREPIQLDLPPTGVSYTGSVLMPLHPVSQISGLHPGQGWRQPLVDPLRDAFASLPGFSGGVRYLNARVLPQPEMLKWGDSETSCLVIEYTDDENETMGRTWVEQHSDRVLQQEAILQNSRWVMTREPRRAFKIPSVDDHRAP